MTSKILIAERRALLLNALQNAFPGREFCAADIVKRTLEPDIGTALTANFGRGWGQLPREVIAIKIGRLLEQKMVGHKFGDLSLTALGKRQRGNFYMIGPPPTPKVVPFLVIDRVDSEGRIHREILKDRNGEPLRDKSQDAPVATKAAEAPATPKPVEQPRVRAPPPAWRQPTRAELAARHHGISSRETPAIAFQGDGTTAGAGEVSTLWNRSLRNL